MRRRIGIVIAILLLVFGAVGIWYLFKATPAPKRLEASAPDPGLQAPEFHVERPVIPAEVVIPSPTPIVTEVSPGQAAPEVQQPEKKLAPMRIYSAATAPQPTPEEDLGNYAPAYRRVRCKLVNTVDSSNISTPVLGLVTDDLWWGGKLIMAKNSEVNGFAQTDKSRERIAAEGAWTFVLYDPDRCQLSNQELVLKGMALDREDDPGFQALMVGMTVVDPNVKTWGITDGSAGIRGVVLKTSSNQELNLFLAAFINAVGQSVQGLGTTAINGSVASATGASGYIISPATQAAQTPMEHYAQSILDQIQRDGFFIRIPAGKLFYVLVTEDIWTGRAVPGGFRRLHQIQEDFLNDRELEEKVTEPRSERDARKQQQQIPFAPVNPGASQKLDETAQRLAIESQALQQETEQLASPTPSPTP